jgi:hypothetical protein
MSNANLTAPSTIHPRVRASFLASIQAEARATLDKTFLDRNAGGGGGDGRSPHRRGTCCRKPRAFQPKNARR